VFKHTTTFSNDLEFNLDKLTNGNKSIKGSLLFIFNINIYQ